MESKFSNHTDLISSLRNGDENAYSFLVKFYHNHRIFNKRSKRGGKAPVEILTGQQLQKSWIDLLMDKIKEAFEKHKVKSLKDLHQIVCKKAIPKIESVKLPKKETSQQVIATIAA